MRRLTSAPKPCRRASRGSSPARRRHASREPVADAVVAGQVGRRLGRGDDVVGREAVVGVRQVDVDDLRAGGLERCDRLADARLDAGLHALDEVLPRQTRAARRAASSPLRRRSRGARRVVGHGDRRRRRVALGRARRRRRAASAASRTSRAERPDLVERAGEGDDAVAADAAVGRLEPDHAGRARRLADRAAGVGADGERNVERRHGRRRSAGLMPPGTRSRSQGLAVGPKARVLGRRAHGELVHVGLAGHDGAGGREPLRDVRVVGADDSPPGSGCPPSTAGPGHARGP